MPFKFLPFTRHSQHSILLQFKTMMYTYLQAASHTVSHHKTIECQVVITKNTWNSSTQQHQRRNLTKRMFRLLLKSLNEQDTYCRNTRQKNKKHRGQNIHDSTDGKLSLTASQTTCAEYTSRVMHYAILSPNLLKRSSSKTYDKHVKTT